MTKKGQSIIEYVLIATLIILGIYFMGPYVLRSINAHYKLWDEGVQDSFQENMRQAPPGDVPTINSSCQCYQSNEGCGTTLCGGGAIEQDWTCTPIGCNGASRAPTCQPSDTCCSAWTPGNPQWFQGNCGTVPLNQPVQPNTQFQGTNCNYGQRIYSSLCPDLGIVCIPDTTCPMPVCTGFVLFQNSTYYCATNSITPPTTAQAPNLVENTENDYVGNGPGSCQPISTGSPCQVYCNSPFTINSTKNGCALLYTVASTSCSAPTNFPNTAGAPPAPYCYSQNWPYVLTVNDQSFTLCVNSITTIKTVISVPYGSQGGSCGTTQDPQGTPGQQCAIAITY